MFEDIFTAGEITKKAKALFQEEREIKRLDGWFLAKETEAQIGEKYQNGSLELQRANILHEIVRSIPLTISEHAIFAGTQRDAFAKSYALINPSFKVEEFSGYCDPTAVFGDIEPNDEFTSERIEKVREYIQKTPYVQKLNSAYHKAEDYTKEVLFFMEQVTGHIIPDFRYALKYGVGAMIAKISDQEDDFVQAMKIALDSVRVLAERYAKIAEEQLQPADDKRKNQLKLMMTTLEKVSEHGATNLYEAMQLYLLLWQVMCLEQAPNPYAFSLGNVDRIFEPYWKETSREEAAALFKHFLVFYNVGDRSWAISQNIIIGGKDINGNDLTNEMSYAMLDAYYDMNLPQPILSVKLHKNTPDHFYRELGKFFFTPGVLTPSLFNDDAMFTTLEKHGVDKNDLPDYSIAGCQEPLIMGKDNANTTNSWLNLPKILEVILTGGVSTISGQKIMDVEKANLADIRNTFYQTVDRVADEMCGAANEATVALSELRVPFLSAFMGGIESGADMRDCQNQGTKYNGSGCLVHGLSVIADSFAAIDEYIKHYDDNGEMLCQALKCNFKGYDELRMFLIHAPKFGNHIESVDREAAEIAKKVSGIIRSKKNVLGNPFRPDFSSPSTHLLYGYWVGATPDGRGAREMLGYGVDPLYGEASNGLGFRMLSNMELPFDEFNGGYASHLGIDPQYFTSESEEDKGIEFKQKIINPLFFNELNPNVAPFYLYVNVTTPEILKKVLAEPKKYAPSGVYIMRIHGTFVNFLDLSPAIQQDIIKRLDLKSTAIA